MPKKGSLEDFVCTGRGVPSNFIPSLSKCRVAVAPKAHFDQKNVHHLNALIPHRQPQHEAACNMPACYHPRSMSASCSVKGKVDNPNCKRLYRPEDAILSSRHIECEHSPGTTCVPWAFFLQLHCRPCKPPGQRQTQFNTLKSKGKVTACLHSVHPLRLSSVQGTSA